ncbi:auxin-responsive protein [Striga asiatica]|uniref:Auxin-responsive protein n=1 Tax=Striga asiatica TaxID=4170 RepID=A0A5A7NWS3_STRAF|nr:auxin-responsive protein [Striga asiatica]
MRETLHLACGGVISGGLMSNLTREDNGMVISSEDSSSYPDELELGLGLGLGGRRVSINPPEPAAGGGGGWDQYARILTAKDFPPPAGSAKTASSSSSTSSSSVTKANVNNNGACGTKRTAESPSSPPGRPAISQVVGWPPVRTYRLNSLANQSKSPVTEDFFSAADKCTSKNPLSDKANQGGTTNYNNEKEKGPRKKSLFVKVNMDGIAIGRKLDLSAHNSYETLARALDDMFKPRAAFGARRLNVEEQVFSGTRQPLQLLDSSSDFVLTYEDKDGDWMLVGDVPWEMFLNSVRRLRIMRTTEVNGLGTHVSAFMNNLLNKSICSRIQQKEQEANNSSNIEFMFMLEETSSYNHKTINNRRHISSAKNII